MKCPLSGKKSNWKNWIKAPMKYRWPGMFFPLKRKDSLAIWSSFLFSFGCICYASSGSYLGYATRYALPLSIHSLVMPSLVVSCSWLPSGVFSTTRSSRTPLLFPGLWRPVLSSATSLVPSSFVSHPSKSFCSFIVS